MTRTASVGDAERSGQLAAHAEGPLRSGPDGELAVLPLRDGRTRLERRVGDVGDRVSLLELDVARLRDPSAIEPARLAVAVALAARPAALRLQALEEILARDPGSGFPLGLDRRQRTRGQRAARRGDADEITVADDDHARHRLGAAEIDRCKRRPERRRPQHLAEQHARQPDVGGILMAARHERAAVDFRLRNGRRSSSSSAASAPYRRRRSW